VETCLLSHDKLSFLNKLDKPTRDKVNKVLLEYFQQHRAELVPVKKPWRVRVRDHLKKSRVRAFLKRILEHVVGGTLAGIISNIVSAGLIILMFWDGEFTGLFRAISWMLTAQVLLVQLRIELWNN
jgi:hypothetical protein